MKIAGDVELPDKCPPGCPGGQEIFDQGGLCARCPIFCTADIEYDGTKMRLIEPESYRRDWALAWKRWFETGMKGFPDLYL